MCRASVDLDAHLLRSHLHWTPSPRLFLALWEGSPSSTWPGPDKRPRPSNSALVMLAAVSSLGQGGDTALAVAGVVWLVVIGFVVNAGVSWSSPASRTLYGWWWWSPPRWPAPPWPDETVPAS